MVADDFKVWVTKKRLTEWGNWCYQIMTLGLGYSHRSLLTKLSEGGLTMAGTAKLLLPTNARAEEVNDLIERLAAQQPDGEGKSAWATVIRIHYTMRNKDIKTKAKMAAVTERTYYRYLREAHQWLSRYLTMS